MIIEPTDNSKSKSELQYLKTQLEKSYKKAPVPRDLQKLRLIVFGSQSQETTLKSVCQDAGFKFFVKPTETSKLRAIVLGEDKGENERTASAVTITPTERSDA